VGDGAGGVRPEIAHLLAPFDAQVLPARRDLRGLGAAVEQAHGQRAAGERAGPDLGVALLDHALALAALGISSLLRREATPGTLAVLVILYWVMSMPVVALALQRVQFGQRAQNDDGGPLPMPDFLRSSS